MTTANLVMEEALEQIVLAELKPAPKVFLRYVNDCFCILCRNDVNRFLHNLTAIESAMQLTVEKDSLLLDLLVPTEKPCPSAFIRN